ncbi:MAG: methyltransferase, putative, family [Clostridiales bacterium]|nr:methyltransferase, putative, family [Clostridiales bacterium]
MEQKSMTALVSAFSRVYHHKNNMVRIFDDSFGEKILSEDEYLQISNSMKQGIKFFNPTFNGNDEEALGWIVDNQLSPSPLGRSAYVEKMLGNAVSVGAKQYLIFAAGYDTFAYRQPDYAKSLQIFEIDHPLTSKDKQTRVNAVMKDKITNLHYIMADFTQDNWQEEILSYTEFDKSKISFCSLLGISYYLKKQDFKKLIYIISQLVPEGSSIVFDYPDQDTYTEKAGERTKKQVMMANATGEKMFAAYSYNEVEELLSGCGFLIYEHLEPSEITEQYFKEYNNANPIHPMSAFDNVNYCLAVKC